MCGICGVYGHIDPITIYAMMDTLKHRGPDGEGCYIDEQCGLGHRRLSIIDLSQRGKQPMSNESGNVWSVVNGEIYNYRDLRSELIAHGHSFKSSCDSEVLPHAYEEWGDGFVTRLRGMFALAIYDAAKRKLILVRDPIGKKPLYYAESDGKFAFASEIKALFKAGIPCKVNHAMIPTFLMYQYTMGTDTLFDGVKKLPAGHILVLDGQGMKLSRYWSIQEGGTGTIGGLRDLLEESVKLRLQADVPIGSFLSGGIDSSAVTALYSKYYQGNTHGDLHTFTATFGEKSEAPYAKQVAEHLGAIYHEVAITPEMVARDIEKITWHHDEPLGDAATINNYYLAQEAKKYVSVVLAGEGGDELFGGYPWYHYAKYLRTMDAIPKPLKMTCSLALAFAGTGDASSPLYGLGRKLEFPCQLSSEDTILYPTTSMNDQSLAWLLKQEYSTIETASPITVCVFREPLNRALAMDCLNKLPEQYLMKADKGTMSFAVEERLPILDQKVIEYAFALPVKLKKDKYALRKAVEDLLPENIVWRPKKGFGTPIREWMTESLRLRAMVLDRLTRGGLLREICKPKPLEKLAGLVADGRLNGSGPLALSPANVVWSLFALQTWSDVWFGGAHDGVNI